MAMGQQPEKNRDLATLTWSLFLLLVLAVVIITVAPPLPLLLVVGFIFALLFAFRYIYFSFYLALALMPLLGVMISVPSGGLLVGQVAFGGSVDVYLVEIAMFVVVAAWALRSLLFWWGRHDINWRPRLPLFSSYIILWLAHVVSMFSQVFSNASYNLQYSLRPVLFDYVAFVALPVNLLRSRKRLITALGVTVAVGCVAAFTGLVAVFFPANHAALFGRAHPLPIFGVNVLGENQNELAEVMVYTSFFAWAMSLLAKNARNRRLLVFAGVFQCLIGLACFTRTFWIVSAVQFVFLCCTEWRKELGRYFSFAVLTSLMLLPFAAGMVLYLGSYTVRTSNESRLMLSEIAWEYFKSNPLIGVGAGNFVNVVKQTSVFSFEYGTPLDSHGFLQKLAAETGILGLLALAFVIWHFATIVRRGMKQLVQPEVRKAYLLILTGALGAFMYQLFNTDYWTGKMWLPIGLALAALYALRSDRTSESST